MLSNSRDWPRKLWHLWSFVLELKLWNGFWLQFISFWLVKFCQLVQARVKRIFRRKMHMCKFGVYRVLHWSPSYEEFFSKRTLRINPTFQVCTGFGNFGKVLEFQKLNSRSWKSMEFGVWDWNSFEVHEVHCQTARTVKKVKGILFYVDIRTRTNAQ